MGKLIMISIFNNKPASNPTKKGLSNMLNAKTLVFYGAGGETRTLMRLPPEDFESEAR